MSPTGGRDPHRSRRGPGRALWATSVPVGSTAARPLGGSSRWQTRRPRPAACSPGA
jgi:hypothetical protein